MKQNGTWSLTDPFYGEFYKMLFFQFEDKNQENKENSGLRPEQKQNDETKEKEKVDDKNESEGTD